MKTFIYRVFLLKFCIGDTNNTKVAEPIKTYGEHPVTFRIHISLFLKRHRFCFDRFLYNFVLRCTAYWDFIYSSGSLLWNLFLCNALCRWLVYHRPYYITIEVFSHIWTYRYDKRSSLYLRIYGCMNVKKLKVQI